MITMKATVAHATIGMMISKCGAGILYVVPVAKRSPLMVKRKTTQHLEIEHRWVSAMWRLVIEH